MKRLDSHDLREALRKARKRSSRDRDPAKSPPTALATERSIPLQEIPLNDSLRAAQGRGEVEADLRAFSFGECSVLLGSGPHGWHISIAHPRRYPTWDEVAAVRYRLVPDDVCMAMILPPQAEYVNWHVNCFHLWEIK